MSILLIGLNHRTAPVELREQMAFSAESAATALTLFRKQFPNSELVILSTCNRVEIFVASETGRPNADDVVTFLAQARDLPVRDFRANLYELKDEQAVRHLFRVAAGLDSMLLGEDQILHQIKAAYNLASQQGTTGRLLNRAFHHAFTVGKRIRTETQINQRKVSIPSVAVDVTRQVFSDLTDKHVLVIGAGEMSRLVCEHLHKAQVRRFTVISRTLASAAELAQRFDAAALPIEQLDEALVDADIVITATNCPVVILTAERLRLAQRRRRGRPMFIIDLAVPRDVEPAANALNQMYLYDIDALGRIVADNQAYRSAQTAHCEQILDAEMDAFEQWLGEFQTRPLIRQMYRDAHQLRDAELARLCHACPDLTPAQQVAVVQVVDRLMNKLMHPCVQTLRQHKTAGSVRTLAESLHDVARKIVGTGPDDPV